MFFDASGNLYATNIVSNTIERFTPSGAASVFASAGLGPSSLAFEPAVATMAVPEPASLAVLAIGVAGLGLTRRKGGRFLRSLARSLG